MKRIIYILFLVVIIVSCGENVRPPEPSYFLEDDLYGVVYLGIQKTDLYDDFIYHILGGKKDLGLYANSIYYKHPPTNSIWVKFFKHPQRKWKIILINIDDSESMKYYLLSFYKNMRERIRLDSTNMLNPQYVGDLKKEYNFLSRDVSKRIYVVCLYNNIWDSPFARLTGKRSINTSMKAEIYNPDLFFIKRVELEYNLRSDDENVWSIEFEKEAAQYHLEELFYELLNLSKRETQ